MGKENDLISASLASEFFETETPSVDLEKLRLELLDFVLQHPSSPVALVTVRRLLFHYFSLVEQPYHLKRTLFGSWIISAVAIVVSPSFLMSTKVLPVRNNFLGKAMQSSSYLDSTQCNRSSEDSQLFLSCSRPTGQVLDISLISFSVDEAYQATLKDILQQKREYSGLIYRAQFKTLVDYLHMFRVASLGKNLPFFATFFPLLWAFTST